MAILNDPRRQQGILMGPPDPRQFMGPPAPGVLMQTQPGALMSGQAPAQMPKPGFWDYVGDVALPLLATVATGGFGAPAALMYGLSKAQDRHRLAGDPLANATYAAQTAQANYLSQHPDIGIPGQMNVPAEIQIDQYAQHNPDYLTRLEQRRQAGGIARQYTDAQGNVWGVYPNGEQVQLGQSMQSPVGFQRQQQFQTGLAGGQEAAKIAAQTAPGAVNAQASAAAQIGAAQKGAEKSATDRIETMNSIAASVATEQQALAALQSAISKVESGPDTNVASDWMRLISPEIQVLNQVFNDQFLQTLAANAQNFKGALSDKEGDAIRSVGGVVTNTREANLQILRNRAESLKRSISAGRQAYGDYSQSQSVRPLPPALDQQRPSLGSFER